MIDSRALYDLHEPVAMRVKKFLDLCKLEDIVLLITSTYRDIERQNKMYEIGRRGVRGEKVITWAKGGNSFHNYRCAVDVVPVVYSKPIWADNNPIWQRTGELGELAGLEWAGRWAKPKTEYCHFQYTGNLTLKELQQGEEVT